MRKLLNFVGAVVVCLLAGYLLGGGEYAMAAFFSWNITMATGTSTNPLDQAGGEWKYKYLPYPCVVEVLHRATVTGVLVQITSGSDEIQQESPVSAGGTDGVLTGRLNVEPVTFKGAAGDLIAIRYRNTNAGNAIVQGTIELTKVAA